jgi:hypothetical protein
MTLRALLVLTLLAAASDLAAATEPFAPQKRGVEVLLAGGGKARLPVVISRSASDDTRAVASELTNYLQRITGAPFSIEQGDGTRGIVLGTAAEFPALRLGDALQMLGPYNGREAFVIRSERDHVLLIGATDLAASHAAFRFLELLGCRWFFPAPDWEVIPSERTLRFSADEVSRPAILSRRIWYGWGHFADEPKNSGRIGARRAYVDWARHNRMAGSFTVNAGHAWDAIIASHKSDFEKNPEYYALVKGQRKGPQVCLSQRGVRDMLTKSSLDWLRRNSKADMVSMEPSDGGGQCECGDCTKLGSISERVFGLANEVARAVQTNFPGKMVGLYAYNEHCEPPSFPLETNVYVQLTAGFITGKFTFDELSELWPARCHNMGFYEYFSIWLWDFDRLPGGRAVNISYLQKRIRHYASHGATSMDAESGNNWGPHGRGYYVANRLMWDPNVNVSALLDDFYEKAFGRGADAMRRYYERLDPGNTPLMSRHLLALAFRDVEEASRDARSRPDVQRRLDHIKQYLRYIHLRWLIDREKDKERKKELTLAALTHAYRTRYSFMNHWEAMRQAWLPQAAKEFNEPSWVMREKSVRPPWMVDTEYSADETSAVFAEGLAYFQPERVEEKNFSITLQSTRFTNAPTASAQSYQGSALYALHSAHGEPLKIEVTTGTIAWYRDRPPARYTLLNSSNTVITTGRIPLDGEPHQLQFEVPASGVYFFDFDDSSAGWRIRVAPSHAATIVLRRDKGYSHQGHMQPMFFYVPRGTRELHYFWSGGPHKVFGPDGKLIQHVTTNGDFVKVPVPAGGDGQMWSLRELALGHLWFFNAPNQLAASPGALLLPMDMVRRDKLGP